jgi:Na+/melibiose symporter-like transporter
MGSTKFQEKEDERMVTTREGNEGMVSGSSLKSMVMGAAVLLAGLMLVDVLPNMLKSLYGAMSEALVFSYGVFAFSVMGIVLFIVLIGVVRDLPAFYESMATFGWRTREAYLAGRPEKEKKNEKK